MSKKLSRRVGSKKKPFGCKRIYTYAMELWMNSQCYTPEPVKKTSTRMRQKRELKKEIDNE